MKKKIINGILLVAMLFATSSTFVSCKDNDADSNTELLGKIANLEQQIKNLQLQAGPQGPAGPAGPAGAAGQNGKDGQDGLTPTIGENGNWFIGTTDTGVKAAGTDGQTPTVEIKDGYWWINGENTNVPASATFDATEILKKLKELEDELAKLKPGAGSTDPETIANIEKDLKEIQKTLDELKKKLETLSAAAITGIEINKITNPYLFFDTPLGIESKLLIALYGEAKKKVTFYNPITKENETVAVAGTLCGSNAGNIYVTVNPFTTDFSGKNLKLVNTAGQEAPAVELTALEASDVALRRADNTGLYKVTAKITDKDVLDKIAFNYLPEDMEGMKETIKAALKERNKEAMLELASKIWNIFSSNSFPLYQLEANWEDGCYKSKADINLVSFKPFSYDFDLNDVANYKEDNITALESLEEYVVKTGTKTASTQNKIWRFLNRVNPTIQKFLDNINWFIQPTLLIDENGDVWHPSVATNVSVFTRFKAGTINLMPTSWSAELVAPAYKKFVGVIEVDGKSDPEELAKVNTGNLGKLVDGSVKSIPLTIEAGKTYKIQYTAIDYAGRARNLYYNIRGTK